uniref:Metalloendopeptidase n=1 Tax=Acrobeloides nanus TaxID=290746 RepID=A0A914DRX9_9BILA
MLLWSNNTVPYELSNRYSNTEKSIIRSSLNKLESKTCFKFVNRNAETDYLYIDKLDGCFSYVGKIGGRQLVSLGDGCVYNYIIWHEIMHALGVEHEHQRPDRDAYIRINYNNIEPGLTGDTSSLKCIKNLDQFDKVPYRDVMLVTPYDYHSIMHYDSQAFGRFDPKLGTILETMVPKKKGIKIYDVMRLSASDYKKLRFLGECPSVGI